MNFFYAAHHASAFRQAYLVDGVAAAAFVVFVVTVSRAMASPGRRAASMPSVVVFTSIGLATASFILVGLFAWLDHRVGGGARNVASALTAVRAIDALRLVLLAALVALASTVVRHSPAVSLQIQRLGVLAAVFLAVGALDYVAGGPVFLATHAVALLALLMWTATLSFSMLRQQP